MLGGAALRSPLGRAKAYRRSEHLTHAPRGRTLELCRVATYASDIAHYHDSRDLGMPSPRARHMVIELLPRGV